MENMPRNRTKEDVAFGERVKAARKALTDQDATKFARHLGLNPHTYSNYERGDRRPIVKHLAIMVDEGMSLYWLYLARPPVLILNRDQYTG